MKIKKVLIIGGGVAGPVLGLFLRRAGVDVEIMEASEAPSEAGGALGIAANGMHVLTAAGVAELCGTSVSRLEKLPSRTNAANSSPWLPCPITIDTGRLASW